MRWLVDFQISAYLQHFLFGYYLPGCVGTLRLQRFNSSIETPGEYYYWSILEARVGSSLAFGSGDPAVAKHQHQLDGAVSFLYIRRMISLCKKNLRSLGVLHCMLVAMLCGGCDSPSEPTQMEVSSPVGASPSIGADFLSKEKADYWSPGPANDPVKNANDHWAKHRNEFPEFRSAQEYVEAAQNFLARPPPGTLKKSRNNGDILLYHPSTNTFAVGTSTGTPRTMFRPSSGRAYWKRQ